MFIQISKIQDVRDFEVESEHLAFMQGSGLFNAYLYLDKNRIIDEKVVAVRFFEDKLYFVTVKDRYYSYGFNEGVQELPIKASFVENNLGLFFVRSENYERVDIYKSVTGDPISSMPNYMIGSSSLIERDSVISHFEGKIHAYSLPSATPLWTFSIDSFPSYIWQEGLGQESDHRVDKFLGVYKERLYVKLSNETILVLNQNNGEYIEMISDVPVQSKGYYTVETLGNCMKLDREEGKIKGFIHFVYWELDLDTNQIKAYNLEDTLNAHDLFGFMNIISFSESETHYFVTMKRIDEDEGSVWSYLVALNKETKVIDWKEHITWTGNHIPQYSSGKLYQRDTENNLYIFEREE